MNWYKKAQYDMYGQPLEFEESTTNNMYDQLISDKRKTWWSDNQERIGTEKDYQKEMKNRTGQIEWMSPDEYINRCLEGNYNSPSAAIPSTENQNRRDFQKWKEDNQIVTDDPQVYEKWKKDNFTEDRPYQEYKKDMLDYRRNSELGEHWNYDKKDWDNSEQNKIESFQDRWIAGEKPPMGYITYTEEGEYYGQEGLHRAMMAKDMGIDEIPVLIITRK
jgi:hypothetical protein